MSHLRTPRWRLPIRKKRRARRSQGFTLVELIIVIIILGILAALALAQFTTSTQDAKEATLQAQLATWRKVIALYYHEHDSTYPGAVKEDGSGAGTSGPENPSAFINQLTSYTNKAGQTSPAKDAANFPYGPYVSRIPECTIPKPGDDADGVRVTADAGALTSDALPFAWKYSKMTGKIICNCGPYQGW
jgi:general secretion pathway protein G